MRPIEQFVVPRRARVAQSQCAAAREACEFDVLFLLMRRNCPFVQVVTHFFGEELFGETCDQVHARMQYPGVPLECPLEYPIARVPLDHPQSFSTSVPDTVP